MLKSFKLRFCMALMCANAFCAGVNIVENKYMVLSVNLVAVICVYSVIMSVIKERIRYVADKAFQLYIKEKKYECNKK